MFKKLIINTWKRPTWSAIRRLSSTLNNNTTVDELTNYKDVQVLNADHISTEDNILNTTEKTPSVLEPTEEDMSHVAPYLRPTFNFAAYVNKSETLQQLVNLGVDLYKLEKNVQVPDYLLKLDFDKDMKSHIMFLHDLGLEVEEMGKFITKNPFIFREDLDNLRVRINYLKAKKFDDAMILRIVQANPLWLSFLTSDIDQRLGFLQKTFSLSGNEVRLVATKKPKLVTYQEKKIKVNLFVIKEEMGFSNIEIKKMLLKRPGIFTKDQKFMLKAFEYVHKNMKIPLETIAEMPGVLTCREFKLKQRHLFLEALGKVQFDPKKPNYVSLQAMVSGSDADFATEVAGSSILTFNAFLKTM